MNIRSLLLSCLAFDFQLLKGQGHLRALDTAFKSLIQKSQAFEATTNIKIPTQANKIVNLGNTEDKRREIAKHAEGTRVILHSKVVEVIRRFLSEKVTSGTDFERTFYEKMSVNDFIERCIIKRPLQFYGSLDTTITRSGGKMNRPHSLPENIKSQIFPLQEYLSYEEIAISALIGVSTPTFFINKGDRLNRGQPASSNDFQKFGIAVALVGTRFENRKEMESRFILNNERPKEWEPIYGEATDYDGEFNVDAYKRRLKVTFETLLYEAERRAIEYGKPAYVSVVGLGLGVWSYYSRHQSIDQNVIYIDTFIEVLENIRLKHVAVVDFTWIIQRKSSVVNTKAKPVQVVYSKRNMADPVDEQYLLIATYAWDGNAYPGNEFWGGALSASGDPAAASCSTIPELQNPLINDFTKKILVVNSKSPRLK